MSLSAILDRSAGQRVRPRRKKKFCPARFNIEALELRLPLTVTVTPAISVAASQDQVSYGQAVTLTASITPPPGGGTVSFLDNGALLGSGKVTSGTATLSNQVLVAGSHHITASFSGFSNAFVIYTGSSTVPLITTVAGDGTQGFAGDKGPATAAELNGPSGAAVDSAGDLFIADTDNNRIREVDHATGVINTVAGDATLGFAGDNRPATSAELFGPLATAVDAAGDLFIADTFNNRIREVKYATGVITTVAGDGTQGFAGDNGPATAAELNSPEGIAVDSAGDLFVADRFNYRIREVDHATGVITTVAGVGTGLLGDNGPATSAELAVPVEIAFDAAGDMFIADSGNERIREVDHATGIITTVAGVGNGGFAGDNGPATAAEINDPSGIAVDATGDLFIADGFNNRIRKVDHATGVITTVAGGGIGGLGDNGPATSAELFFPGGIAVDASGDLFIADSENNRIREVANGVTVTVSPAPLTVTADNKSKVYGVPLPALTASYSGFVNGDTAASLATPPTLSTTATAGSRVSGSPYSITASGAVDANYTISYVAGALTVTPAPLTITADNQSKVYGAALPALTSSYSGFVSGDSAASLTTPPTLATTATAGSHVSGSPYPITASGAVDADYTISYIPGALTVSPAPLTVTADNKTKVFGAANPLLTDTISGFMNGDSPSVVSGAANLNTTATAASGVGSYPITAAAGTLSAVDYTFAFVNGTLTVAANLQGNFGLVEDLYVIGSGTVNVSTASGVLANDVGPGQLTVTSGTVTGAEGGTFVFNADGSFAYALPAHFPGFDYAKYTATDTLGDQATATVNVLSQTGGVVWKFYESVLHRDPDYAGLQFWINDFANGGKTGDIAVGFFESTELLNQIIGGFYEQYLGRAADSGGLSFYEDLWRKTGGPEQIKAGFAVSPEFHALALAQFGAYPDGWLEALYHRILNRTPSKDDLTFWEQQLTGGTSEFQVALDFFTSPEAFDNDVTGWYFEYLLRAPTLAEQAQFANQMTAGASDRTIEQAITNLPEYGANPPASPTGAGVRLPDYFPATTTGKTQASLAARDAVFGQLAG